MELGSVFNTDALAKDGIRSHPSVDETSIVPNLVSITLDGLHNVQIVVAADSTQHDVADGEPRRVYGRNSTKLARFDSAPHRASARTERYCLSGPELINVVRRPPQRSSSQCRPELVCTACFAEKRTLVVPRYIEAFFLPATSVAWPMPFLDRSG
jgi:hypothetical protein